ncbi:MAG: beta-propeller fold lactonase family protein [Thermoguttaceae bacterium]|jgi:YVTN family beta-propeller protein
MNISRKSFGLALPSILTIALAAALCAPSVAQGQFGPGPMPGQFGPRGFPGQPMMPPRFLPVVVGNYLGPDAIAASRDGKTLFIALADAHKLAFFDVAGNKVTRTIALPAAPTALALSPDGKRLYITCAAVKSTVAVIETAEGKIVDSIPVGHTAHGVAVTPDGNRLYVCNRFNNDVSVIETAGDKQIARVAVTREPYAAVATPDGKTVFVVNQLPLDRADSYDVAAGVSAIDTASNQATTIRLPNGSSSVRGICVSPDGRYVYVVHVLSHFELPATQLERGWVNTNAMSIIDAPARRLFNTVLLDDVDLGAALPWGVTTSGDGKAIFVTHGSTHELSRINVSALMDKLNHLTPAAAAEVPNDLSLLATLRQRVQLAGNGPRGVAVIGDRAYVAEYFTDTLSVVDLKSQAASPVTQIALGPKPQLTQERRGEMLFFDATICFQHWQSCGTCHPDARMDGLNWDLPNDGLGNPKNTRNLLHVFYGGPAMSLGVRENAAAAVRAGITHVLFAVRPEEDALALDAYLRALQPVPSPYLVDGKLSPAAERGKALFFNKALGCAECHPAPYYCDKKTHSVGSVGKYDKPTDQFNTPRLTEVWRTAPYMHDGQYLTIPELFNKGQHGLQGDKKPKLSAKDIEDLSEFVNTL